MLKCVRLVRAGVLAAGLFAGLASVRAQAQESATLPPPAHPVTAEQVQRLMAVTHATELMRDGIHKMITQQQAAFPLFPSGFWTDFETEMAKIDWVAIATPVYQKYLSQEDAETIIAFYKTDAGQRALHVASAVMTEMTAKGFDIGKEIGARVGAKYADQIQQNMKNVPQAVPTNPK